MGRTSTATINYTLTAYAVGLMNDLRGSREIDNALMPTVRVDGASGQYKIFSDVNSFQVYNTTRGLGGSARRIEFSGDDGAFNCTPQALEVTVDDHERERAGRDNAVAQQLLDQGKIRALLNGVGLGHTKKITDFVAANTAPVADRGNWSNANIDPIDQLDEQLEALVTQVGSKENLHLVLGLSAWRKLRMHPKVKGRAAGVKTAGITLDDLKAMLMLPVNVVVGVLSHNENKPGNTVSKKQVLGDICYLTYSVPNPTVYDPSPFKIFTTGENNIESVRTYRDEAKRSDVHAIDWSEDLKLTSSASIIRLDIS